ncbi:MAG: hypothetical protein SOV26_05240 [Candidatus Onthovivens sp.]|nr:hypothetical protein [Candidatus Onthovivens sp.]
MLILADIWNNPAMILLLLIIAFGIIALIVFFIRKIMFKNKNEDKPNENDAVEDTLNRQLEDVEDEETIKEFDNYAKEKEKEDK